MNTGVALAVGIGVGVVLGGVGTHLLFDDEPVYEQPEPMEVNEAPTSEPTLRTAASAPAVEEEPLDPEPGDLHVGRGVFAESYRAVFKSRTGDEPAQAQINAAWEQLQVQTAGAAAGAAGQSAHMVLADRRRAEITARDDIMSVLTDRNRSDDVLALRNDPEALTTLLAQKIKGPQVSGPGAAEQPDDEPLEDGSRIYFPNGAYTLTEQAVLGTGRNRRMPRDLTIEGAGIDRTLITLSDFSARDLVYNLHLRDCTIDCGNDGAFDLGREKASVFAENVRFVRFDAGHGGCYIFAFSRGGAVYCKDCRFDGGYGRAPGKGSITRHVQVGRFESCLFDRVSYEIGRHSRAYFADCVFRDCGTMEKTLKQALASPNQNRARFDGCTVEYRLSETGGRVLGAKFKRDLTSLFPTFKGKR